MAHAHRNTWVESLEPRQLLTAAPVFATTPLTSDGAAAAHVDANLVNPWGVAFAPGGEFWISDNGTGKSTLYDGTGAALPLVVTIPGVGGSTSAPTGQVANTAGFNVTENGVTGSSAFIFDSEDGIISGWSPAVDQNNAIVAVDNSATAVYKGLAIAIVNGSSEMFAANFKARSIDVFDSNFAPVAEISGAFFDKSIPKTYAPFNVQNIGGNIVVTYAKQDRQKHDDVAGAGHGMVDVFSPTGELLLKLKRGAFLNSPWAVATATSTFGKYSGDLLIGNFGNGTIDIFNPANGRFISTVKNAHRQTLKIPGLWALTPGSGGVTESADTIYFTAGPNHESHGLFGSIGLTTAIKPVTPPPMGGGYY
ncbi:MAG TPA: TIGR03118 family protein [Tepidisphaeraceae bacterium]|jgi:uncharacterized protein (TIGR03118 family)|nr:TIGR03118 family protein [Tepidisphaeraceae bacterium]